MIFQTLDNKQECVGVFADGELYFNNLPAEMTHTWSYSQFLENLGDIEYAFLYAQKPLDEVCPRHLSEAWDLIDLEPSLGRFLSLKLILIKIAFLI
jgi:hypothetical protein